MLNIPVQFDDLLKVIEELPAAQKQIIRERLDADWSACFGEALAAIHADVPRVPDDELQADIEHGATHPMVISQLEGETNSCSLVAQQEKFLSVNKVTHAPLADKWIPIPVEIFCRNSTSTLIGDFLQAPHGIACNESTKIKLSPYLDSSVEFLPFISENNKYYLLHVIDAVSGLDYEQTEMDYFPTGNVKSITRYVFDPACLEGKLLFVIPERRSRIFATDAFQHLVSEYQLTGIKFRKVWEG